MQSTIWIYWLLAHAEITLMTSLWHQQVFFFLRCDSSWAKEDIIQMVSQASKMCSLYSKEWCITSRRKMVDCRDSTISYLSLGGYILLLLKVKSKARFAHTHLFVCDDAALMPLPKTPVGWYWSETAWRKIRMSFYWTAVTKTSLYQLRGVYLVFKLTSVV